MNPAPSTMIRNIHLGMPQAGGGGLLKGHRMKGT